VRQQVAKSPQRVHKDEEREQEPQEFGQDSHVGLFWHLFSRRAAPNRCRVAAARNQTSIAIDPSVLPQFSVSPVVQLSDLSNSSERVPRHASQAEQSPVFPSLGCEAQSGVCDCRDTALIVYDVPITDYSGGLTVPN